MRSFYASDFVRFLTSSNDEILGVMAKNNPFDLTPQQRNAWGVQIDILKNLLADFDKCLITNFRTNGESHKNRVIFEYTIPRIGRRIDNVLLMRGIVFLLEFKIGERLYNAYEIDQVLDYVLDVKNFHKESQGKIIAPLLICTHASTKQNVLKAYEDGILKPLLCNRENLKSVIESVLENFPNEAAIDGEKWQNSPYSPTPTIIEAAQALYANHSIEDISRSDSGAYNISLTTAKINEIIEHSKTRCKKSICFITGVPGAGKTLAGINIANEWHKFEENEHAVFLSGNAPLVEVLQEALARDEMAKNTAKTLQNHTAKKIKK